jgi:hypothetical protein
MGQVNAPRMGFRTRLVAAAAIIAAAWVPTGTALADDSVAYAITGVEVWATDKVATFAGAAEGASGDVAAWTARIEHTIKTQPLGRITGGSATVVTSGLHAIGGRFSRGTLRLVDDGGPDCGNLKHSVKARLVDVVRSNSGRLGTGTLHATLIHYRVKILGLCFAWSASVSGWMSLSF